MALLSRKDLCVLLGILATMTTASVVFVGNASLRSRFRGGSFVSRFHAESAGAIPESRLWRTWSLEEDLELV